MRIAQLAPLGARLLGLTDDLEGPDYGLSIQFT